MNQGLPNQCCRPNVFFALLVSDGVLNRLEQHVDCGGPHCAACLVANVSANFEVVVNGVYSEEVDAFITSRQAEIANDVAVRR